MNDTDRLEISKNETERQKTPIKKDKVPGSTDKRKKHRPPVEERDLRKRDRCGECEDICALGELRRKARKRGLRLRGGGEDRGQVR